MLEVGGKFPPAIGGIHVLPWSDIAMVHGNNFCLLSGGGEVTAMGAWEPSHSMGAPDVPEPLTLLGARHLTRYNTSKKFVRATRPALVCASPKTNIRVKIPSLLLVPHLRTQLVRSLWPKKCNAYRGVTLWCFPWM